MLSSNLLIWMRRSKNIQAIKEIFLRTRTSKLLMIIFLILKAPTIWNTLIILQNLFSCLGKEKISVVMKLILKHFNLLWLFYRRSNGGCGNQKINSVVNFNDIFHQRNFPTIAFITFYIFRFLFSTWVFVIFQQWYWNFVDEKDDWKRLIGL